MTIRAKLRLIIGLALAAAMATIGVIAYANMQLRAIEREAAFGSQIRARAIDLHRITADLLLSWTDRERNQWEQARDALLEALNEPPALDSQVDLLRKEIEQRALAASSLFQLLAESGDPAPRGRQRCGSQVTIRANARRGLGDDPDGSGERRLSPR